MYVGIIMSKHSGSRYFC